MGEVILLVVIGKSVKTARDEAIHFLPVVADEAVTQNPNQLGAPSSGAWR